MILEHKEKKFPKRIKRLMDITTSAIGLFFLSPLIVLIGILIKFDSRGPIFYHHKRVGKDGRHFNLLKFRSMYQGKDDSAYVQYLKSLIESERGASDNSSAGGNGHQPKNKRKEETTPQPYRKMGEDPRVTRVGKFLRKYYLDELPQLWNVVRGEMSLVGPRPHVQLEVDYYSEEQCRRLSVPPGLTGLWQVNGKADCTFNELIDLDLAYIDHWSILLDIQIILQTLLLMAHGGEGFWTKMSKRIPRSPYSAINHQSAGYLPSENAGNRKIVITTQEGSKPQEY